MEEKTTNKPKSKDPKENKIIIITAVFNFIVAILKLIPGIAFSFSTLLADSVQSFIDFFTDVTSLMVNRIGKRRANKTYPFGYGEVYYLANIFTGFLMFLIGIFILYQFFFFEGGFEPSLGIGLILVIVLIIKCLVVYLLTHFGKKYKSELMIEMSKESKADLISTIVVLVVLGLSFFEKYVPSFINFDKIGSLGMAIYVFYASIKMIVSNMRGTLTTSEENTEIKDKIVEILNNIKYVDFKNVKVINMSNYYSIFLQVKVDEKITIRKYIAIEKEIKTKLKAANKQIRFIDIHPI